MHYTIGGNMKTITTSVIAAAAFVLGLGPAFAEYPEKPVTIVVPYAPGGATDVVARIVGEEMRKITGQNFVVQNKPGAFGILAIETVAKAAPDGYTLLLGNVTTSAITPVIYPEKFSINYEKDIRTVARVAEVPGLLVASTKVEGAPKTLEDLVSKAKSAPGKIRFTSAGLASYPHLDMEMLARKAGINLVHVPSPAGAAGMNNDLLSGDVHVAFLNAASALPLVKDGKLTALATITKERLPELPDVSTMKELGYEGIGTVNWQALFAPSGVPENVVKKLHDSLSKALKSETVTAAFSPSLFRASPTISSDEDSRWVQNEIAHWKDVASRVNLSKK
jgi:tripartite-type tricarboxylate transporter receptor subunit TctC